jgi:hypothetical protein
MQMVYTFFLLYNTVGLKGVDAGFGVGAAAALYICMPSAAAFLNISRRSAAACLNISN